VRVLFTIVAGLNGLFVLEALNDSRWGWAALAAFGFWSSCVTRSSFKRRRPEGVL
jgi:hypothetical protein